MDFPTDAINTGRNAFRDVDRKYKKKQKVNGRIAHHSAYFAQRSYEHDGTRKNHGMWKYRSHLSDDRISVYKKNNGDTHIAVRGSDFLSPSRGFIDLANDALIAGGVSSLSPEFNNVKGRINDIIDFHKYKHGVGAKVTLSGHSLGGSIVSHIMADPDIQNKVHESHVFNPGNGLQLRNQKHPSHHHIHHNKHDMVNMMARTDSGATWHYHDSGAAPTDVIGAHWNESWNDHSYWMQSEENSEENV